MATDTKSVDQVPAKAPGEALAESVKPSALPGGAAPAAWESEKKEIEGRYEALQQAHTKLENDLKALRGSRLKQADVASEIAEIRAQQRGLLEAIKIVAKAKGEEDAADLDAKFAEAERKAAVEGTGRREQTRYQALLDKLRAVGEEEGMDINTVPELADVRTRWNEVAYDTGTSYGEKLAALSEQYAEAVTIIDRVRNKKRNDAITAERKRKPKEEEAAELDSGPGAGGGAVVTRDNIDEMYLKDPDRYGEQYRKFLRTGKL